MSETTLHSPRDKQQAQAPAKGAPSTARVTAVIVTYQSIDTIDHALDALAESHQGGLAECVVVDNASSDGTADHVARQYPWVRLIRSGENVGFGRGCNLGFEQVHTPYVLILNPDATLSKPALETLVRFMDDRPDAGMAAPAIIEGKSHYQSAGMMLTPTDLLKGALGMGQAYPQRRTIQPGEEPFQTSWICGAAMLIRSELFRQLDGFDPRFFLYFEETDLCRRAIAQGTTIWAVGHAVAHHVGGASAKAEGEGMRSSCISRHYDQSRRYYLRKHFGWGKAIMVEWVALGMQVARRLRKRLKRKRKREQYVFVHRGPFPPEQRDDCTFVCYERFDDVPEKVRQAILANQNEKALQKDEQEMRDGSLFWVAYVGDEVASVRHSRRAELFKNWFVPLNDGDVVIFRGRAFPAFRGRGISPSMMRHIMHTQLKEGAAAYVDCAVTNHASMRSIQKAGFQRLATMKPIKREWALGR